MKNNNVEDILKENQILIYGGKVIAEAIFKWLRNMNPDIQIIGFAVSSKKENLEDICGLPIKLLEEYAENVECPVIIACGKEFHKEIKESLLKKGYKTVYKVDNIVWNTVCSNLLKRELRLLLNR
ncbi:hypothetical protein [Propionispira raffinosivorans]|uniref:hypothetical protein n=1 Tax=Propionispira raffinosivorans TaxID=86959 RepID=UPI000374FF0B|nr:hypothetical protein [Propionispira raffinosivorans]